MKGAVTLNDDKLQISLAAARVNAGMTQKMWQQGCMSQKIRLLTGKRGKYHRHLRHYKLCRHYIEFQ